MKLKLTVLPQEHGGGGGPELPPLILKLILILILKLIRTGAARNKKSWAAVQCSGERKRLRSRPRGGRTPPPRSRAAEPRKTEVAAGRTLVSPGIRDP